MTGRKIIVDTYGGWGAHGGGAGAGAGAGAGVGAGGYWLGSGNRVSNAGGKKVIVIGIDGMDPVLSERMMKAGGLEVGFQRALARSPTADETRILTAIYADAIARFRKDPEAAKKLLAVGESPRDMTLNEAELAAWTTVASTILNLDETITKR